jgi:dienelactone hydrolase
LIFFPYNAGHISLEDFMRKVLFCTLVLSAFSPLSATIKTELVTYKHANATLEGFLAYDDAGAAKKPGIMVVHAWMGLDDNAKNRAVQLAELGYVAFCADIYGKGKNPADMAGAAKMSSLYKGDRQLYRGRLNAGLEMLKKLKFVDTSKLAAIGYCFGGTGVLELARAGAKVNGVVSFHGGLDSPSPQDGKNIKTKILVLHGADDPYNSPENVSAFQKEMRDAHVDWQMVEYGGAVHSFTDEGAGNDNSKGAAYNESADRRSWQAMKLFFSEIFK